MDYGNPTKPAKSQESQAHDAIFVGKPSHIGQGPLKMFV